MPRSEDQKNRVLDNVLVVFAELTLDNPLPSHTFTVSIFHILNEKLPSPHPPTRHRGPLGVQVGETPRLADARAVGSGEAS